MRDLSNLIHERNDVLLQHLGTHAEVMDEAETKDSIGLLALHHWVHITA